MNCLDFRREVLVSPNEITPEARLHEAGCAQCADLAIRLRQMDMQIAEAIQVPVPPSLVDRVLPSQAAPDASRRRFLAMAAGLTLAVGAGTVAYVSRRDDPLALAGIRFVVEEEANAILHARPTDRAALLQVARQMDVALPDQLGELRYVGTCPFEGTIAHHVVVTTPQGKATLLLLPEIALEAPGDASARGLRARVIPAHQGCVAIIATSARGIDRIGRYLATA